jgi:hypothetical protein
MARVHFTADFAFVPPERPAVSVFYKAGTEMTVRRVCVERAIGAGKAFEVAAPVRGHGGKHDAGRG